MKETLQNGNVIYYPGPGHVDYFAGSNPPEGYLVANGAAVSRSAYPELFAVIGTVFGAGDGSTTFNLPNASGGKFIRGIGGNAAAIGVEQGDAIREIDGTFSARANY
ncbi:MAG: phage tail protein, partial [Synergistaceae bacterium]|nr:phage tail protein [Synergistaceae bacterium]